MMQPNYTQREWDRVCCIGSPPAPLTRKQKLKKVFLRIINKFR